MLNFILEIALPVPLYKTFDYLPLPDTTKTQYLTGIRVLVPFGSRQLIGIILTIKNASNFTGQLKVISQIIDTDLLISQQQLDLATWASNYYQYPIGEVIEMCIPPALRKNKPAKLKCLWVPWSSHGMTTGSNTAINLTQEQQVAIDQVTSAINKFAIFLLYGLTGSGKTEVYLQAIAYYLKQDKQILILLPEISLTPQTIERFEQRFPALTTVIHSKLGESERKENWLLAKENKKAIIIGTRSALFCAIPKLGLIIIDEEHDQSFKQQEGLHYNARDLAIIRAKYANIPILLGSATPSLESYNNTKNNKYAFLQLSKRATGADLPQIYLVDLKSKLQKENISSQVLELIKQHLDQDNQVLIFLNRRGYAPTYMCIECGHVFKCDNCSVNLVVHLKERKLICHHCTKVYPLEIHCPNCQTSELITVGKGTEQIEQTLTNHFPNIELIRIDSDSTKKKDSLQNLLNKITPGKKQILVGTQILAKGHHFPNLSLVAILDIDGFLYSSDFRAEEKAAQLLLQVAGRAGREKIAGTVVIETYHPEHPIFKFIKDHDYLNFADKTLIERAKYQLPPYVNYALLRAHSPNSTMVQQFLTKIKITALASKHANIKLLGPIPCPITKRDNNYRWQLLIEAADKLTMQNFMRYFNNLLLSNSLANKLRFSLDIDPIDMG